MIGDFPPWITSPVCPGCGRCRYCGQPGYYGHPHPFYPIGVPINLPITLPVGDIVPLNITGGAAPVYPIGVQYGNQ